MKKENHIFICYRREDSAAIAGRIYDRLALESGKKAVFKDIDSMPLGTHFVQYIDSIVRECRVVLVVMGDRWVDIADIKGNSRLYDPRDFVRIEIEVALRRGIPVIPVLVQNAPMPSEESLPQSLKELVFRSGIVIGHDPHFHIDMDRLINPSC